MTPTADTTPCYICNDKRRTAITDASTTPTGPHADSATLKQTLIRALSHGHAEDLAGVGEEELGVTSGVCVVSLSSRYDGGLEAVSDRVAGDQVVICRRCMGLLKDFDHHEQMAARKAKEIRHFLMRQMQMDEEEEGTRGSASLSHLPQDSMKKIVARSQDERQGIIAAFRAFRKSGIKEVKGKGRKRKKELVSSYMNSDEKADDDDDDFRDEDEMEEMMQENAKVEEERRKQEIASARHSERIQRRREDGLVMRWGDALFENEDDMKLLEDEEDLFDYSPSVLLKERSHARRGRGKKLPRVVRSAPLTAKPEDTEFKFQCPFCLRYYTPMSSRIHNCTSYKNQLRCQVCNIFFTSYVRLEKHLEVIHLQQKQLACSTAGCSFMCIAEPTLTIHKHFHVLESFTGEGDDKEARGTRRAEINQRRKESMPGRRLEEVAVEDDEEGVVSSPEIADRVSFLIDEKTFLSDSHPLNITMDRISKQEGDHKVLRLQGGDRNQAKSLSPNSRVEAGVLTPDKEERKSPKGSNLVLQCPICDLTLVSTRSYQEHIRDIHNLRVTTKIAGEEPLSRELLQKGSSPESLTRIVKYYNVKKNSNVTLRVTE